MSFASRFQLLWYLDFNMLIQYYHSRGKKKDKTEYGFTELANST